MDPCRVSERSRLNSPGICLRGALVGLALLSSLGWIPGSASALGFVIAPGATFDSVSAPSVALTGSFELAPWPFGICGSPCEPDAYSMSAVVLSAGGETLSNGILEPISYVGDISCCTAFEVLPSGSVMTGGFVIERSITSEGILTGDPHNHDYFEHFNELLLAPMSFLDSDPLEVLFSTPRGQWPVAVALAYGLIQRTGIARSGYDGSGSLYFNEVDYLESEAVGQVVFTAHPIPEPGTGLLLLMGMLGLGWRERRL